MRKVSRRDFLRLSATVATGAFLAACQPATPAPETAKKEEAPPTPTPEVPPTPTPMVSAAGTGKTVISYWNGLTGEDGLTMVKIIEGFARENPDLRVEMQRIPWSNFFDKLLAAYVAGTGPDLFILWSHIMKEWQAKGVLKNLDPLFDEMLSADDYFPGVLDPSTIDGHHWGVPIDRFGPALWLNVGLLEAAGIEYDPKRDPLKFDEFIEIAQRLTIDKNGKHPNESGFDPENVDQWGYAGLGLYGILLRQFGQDSGAIGWDGKTVLLTTEISKKALQRAVDMRWKYNVEPRASDFNAAQAMGAGKLAMFYNGSWFFGFWKDHPDIKPGIWPLPIFGEKESVWSNSHNMVLPATLEGEKLEATQKLVKYIADSNLWSAEAAMPPSRKSIFNTPEVQAVWALPSQVAQMARAAWKENTNYPCIQEVGAAINPQIVAALNGDATVDEALQAAEERVKKILDRCWKTQK